MSIALKGQKQHKTQPTFKLKQFHGNTENQMEITLVKDIDKGQDEN